MSAAIHDHVHAPNRFAVIPTGVRLNADPRYTGKGVTIAFLDSGFYPHPDLTNRILCYQDITGERVSLDTSDPTESWQWHGTQTSVVAAGDGHLSDGVYKGLANESQLVLVKVSKNGRITEENIARGIKWIIANRERFNIRVLNISLGGDEDVPCTRSIIDQAAEEAISNSIVVVVAAGNSGDSRSIPPANSPSVITVGGYHDNNDLNGTSLDLYHSNFGPTADGTVKPELVAPAMWVAAPILPGTNLYDRAEALSQLAAAPYVEKALRDLKIVATHYQHVDGTSFAAPIVTSIVAQMLEANPALTPGAIKNILISTADRIADAPAIRQGFGVVNARRAIELAAKEQHALNVVGCSPPRVENGHLVFVYHDDEARAVSLASDFNSWNTGSNALTKDAAGLWLCKIATPGPGRYEYKFVVDDERWIEDPGNGMRVPDGFGGLNSVLVIQ
jgi:serine protease AprX